MDLYIDRDELARGLARVQSVVERRTTQPILSHALLRAHDGGLRITATDTEVAFIGDLQANVEKGGELAVDATNLFQIVRALPDATVRLAIGTGNRLEITSGRAFFRLPGMPAEEYPALPAFDARGEARIREAVLRRLVDQTSFSVASDDARYGLNGAHLEQADGAEGPMVRVVATDGHRLSASEGPFQGELALTPRMLVPRKALAVMRRLLDGEDEEVALSFGEGAVRMRRPGQTVWFRLLDGEFPDYRAVVPTECRHRAVVRREELTNALKRMAILAAERSRAVRFGFGEDEVVIEVHNVDRGEVREKVPMEMEGEPISVGFNVRYLQDILGVLEGDYVQLELAGPLAPCLLKDPGRPEAFFVVMPMRLD